MMTLRSLFRVQLAAGLLLGSASLASAVTAVSNLGELSAGSVAINISIPPPGPCCSPAIGNSYAGSFVTGSAATLMNVTLAMNTGTGNNAFTVQLLGDSGGLPGTVLLTFTGNNNPITAGLYTYTAPAPYSLVGGTQYWVAASNPSAPSSSYAWKSTSSSVSSGDPGWSIGRFASHQYTIAPNSSSPWSQSSTSSVMFSVGIVPEPGTLTLSLLAVATLARQSRRRRPSNMCGETS